MLQYERQKKILEYLEHRNSATIKELAASVFSSEASVRRDIAYMESNGYVERIYGGVLLAGHQNSVVPVNVREASNTSGKETVAQEAAKRIIDGSTVILDASTTAFRICRHIRNRKHLKIITNNLRVCEALADAENIQVYCTGGTFIGSSGCFVGTHAEEFIRSINADMVFFSSQGITEEGKITDVSEQEISIRKVMLRHAKQRYFLCDSTKFGICRPFTLCHIGDIDDVICDIPLRFTEYPPADR